MSSRSLGELLLRPSPRARTSIRQTQTTRTSRMSPSWTARRCISNTPNQTAAQPQRDDDDELHHVPGVAANPQPPVEPQQAPVGRTPFDNEASSRLNVLFSGLPSQRRRPAQSAPPTQPTSNDEARAARGNHVFGADFSSPSSSGFRRPPNRGPPKLNFDDMATPIGMLDPNLSNKPSEAANLATQQEETFANYPRLNPTYGKTVDLDAGRGRDLVRGITMLGSLVARNKIKSEMMSQRFHERGGLRRKRLASLRWRARFKTGFTSITKRVSELTAKGW
ncbi:hypothetical protein BDU57DRAFT_521960 [Ampelomyces quisqualis]|uniref:Uncharacterized protein n=1 Tax=Ampelomyces quisqualis TaxID=50730 RepID=A0A6A5QEG4_AMPQU|nr:hypothetical protein BDU57DRAFT_521960 [Ampelomyces quisqualis]